MYSIQPCWLFFFILESELCCLLAELLNVFFSLLSLLDRSLHRSSFAARFYTCLLLVADRVAFTALALALAVGPARLSHVASDATYITNFPFIALSLSFSLLLCLSRPAFAYSCS